MFLPDNEYQSNSLCDHLLLSPVSSTAIAFFSEIYKLAKKFIEPSIFASLRPRIEEVAGMSLNLRTKADKARFGRILSISELTYRGHALEGFKPLYLLENEPTATTATPDPEPEPQPCSTVKEVEEEETIDSVKQERDRYYQQLQEFEAFTQYLLLGRIFPAPPTTNGLEKAPLLQVFGGARSLQELHSNYQKLLKKWHPDLCSQAPKEAQERFDFLRKAYVAIVNKWSSFNPQNMEIPQSRIDKLMEQELKWKPETWWY